MRRLALTDYDRQVYEKELKDFLPKEFIDFHVHISAEDIGAQGKRNGGASWPALVYKTETVEDLVAAYKLMFPENKVIPLMFGSASRNIPQVNEYVRGAAETYGYPSLLRCSYEMTAEELEKQVIEGGFLGLKPYLRNSPPYIPANEIRIFDFLPHEHLKVADKHGWIIMLHIPRSGRLKDPVNLAQLLEIEERYPNVKLVVAHIGRAYAKEDIGDAFEVLGKTKNMVFDFTANLCDDAIRACLETFGPKRLIFGSDLPIAIMRMYRIVEDGVYYNVVKRGSYGDVTGVAHMRETDEEDVTLMMYEQILALKRVAKELKLTPQDVEDIMYGNAKRLLDSMK